MPILIVSVHDESLYAERALRAGATGYVTKQEATAEVVKAIRKVLDGQVYVSAAVAERMVRRLVTGTAARGASPPECLSGRELEVFRLIGRGYGTRQIAENLKLSAKTIENLPRKYQGKAQSRKCPRARQVRNSMGRRRKCQLTSTRRISSPPVH